MSLSGLADIPQEPLPLGHSTLGVLSPFAKRQGGRGVRPWSFGRGGVGEGLLTEEAIEALDGLVEASTVDLVVQDGLHLRVVDL